MVERVTYDPQVNYRSRAWVAVQSYVREKRDMGLVWGDNNLRKDRFPAMMWKMGSVAEFPSLYLGEFRASFSDTATWHFVTHSNTWIKLVLPELHTIAQRTPCVIRANGFLKTTLPFHNFETVADEFEGRNKQFVQLIVRQRRNGFGWEYDPKTWVPHNSATVFCVLEFLLPTNKQAGYLPENSEIEGFLQLPTPERRGHDNTLNT